LNPATTVDKTRSGLPKTSHPSLPRLGGSPGLRRTKLLVATLTIGLAIPSLPRGDSETKQPAVAPGIQRERVNLILIDVVVTDRKGNRVEDLRPEEFQLRVDGLPHPIESVELVRVSAQAAGADSPKGEGEKRPVEAGPDFEVRRNRRFAFFFDGLNCERGLGPRAIQEARRFLQKGLPPGDEVMVVGQGRELKVYQEFTTDPAKMIAAITAVESDPQIRTSGENRTRQNLSKLKEAEDDCMRCSFDDQQRAVERAAALYAREDRMRTLRSLESLRAIVAYLHSGTGRSELFYFTDGFATDPGAFYGAPDEPDVKDEILRLSREASAAQVVIYPINTQGVPSSGSLVLLRSAPNLDWSSLIESRASDTLAAFAIGTGGELIRMKNSFGPAMERIEQQTRSSYLVTYVPEGNPDGRYHSTKVEVLRKGLKVRAKEGFLWLTDEQNQERTVLAAHLSPELFHDFSIGLEARSYLEEGKKAYLEIAIAVPDASLLFLPREGRYTARLEAGVILRRGRNLIVDQFSREVEATLTEKGFSERGYLTLVSRREVPPGEFEAVTVVRDLGTGNIGALRSTIKVPAFSSDRIAVSSLILESPLLKARRVDIDPATESDPSLVVPVPLRVFTRDAQVSGSCVVYHPQREPATGKARVRVKGSIRRGGETVQPIADSLHTIEAATRADVIPLEFPLPLSSLTPGVYSLEIQALDEVGGRGVTQRVDFLVR
jgi:VWFA-related protein